MATVAAATTLAVWRPTGWWAWTGISVALGILAARAVVRAAERPARSVVRFLEGIRYDDLSIPTSRTGQGPLMDALGLAFGDVAEAVRGLRAEREEQAATLEIIVRHVPVALVAFQDDGTVTLFNLAARRLFEMPRPGSFAAFREKAPGVADALSWLAEGERALLRIGEPDRPREVVAYATRFVLAGTPYTLVSLQDIREELEARELEAWQQLSRVLTHEITNSVAPIASLASTARRLATSGVPDRLGDVTEALGTIERRSRRLVAFVDAYRTLTRLPSPSPRPFRAAELLGDVAALIRANSPGIDVAVEVIPPHLEFVADPDLVEQALVNLALNAAEAIEGDGLSASGTSGHVVLRAQDGENGRPVFEVVDDGPGLLDEVHGRIFVPFFTTKPGGSGVGLTLAQRIARLHGGSLSATSDPNVETVFRMCL